jgi:hypothetical protein
MLLELSLAFELLFEGVKDTLTKQVDVELVLEALKATRCIQLSHLFF